MAFNPQAAPQPFWSRVPGLPGLLAKAHDLGQLKDRTAEHGGPGIPCVVYESAEAAAPGAPAALMKGRRVSWLLPSGHAGACVLDAAPGSAVMHRPDRFGWGVAEKHRGLPTVCAAHGVSADTWDAFIKEVNTCLEECRSSVGWVPGVSAFMSMFTQPKAKHAIATCKSIVDKYNEAHFHQAGLKVSFVTHDDEMLRRVRIAGWRRTQKEAGYTGWEPVDRDMDEAKMFQAELPDLTFAIIIEETREA